MERSFIITKESKYLEDYNNYKKMAEQQRKFVKEFLTGKGEEGNEYVVGGDGRVNKPFSEYSKDNITLSIKPTESDLIKFGKVLNKPNKHHGLCSFRKNSKIAKEFAQKCIDEQVVINLYSPRIGDHFESLGYGGYSSQRFLYNGILYLRIESEYLKEDTPVGFTEIKLSEYYSLMEKCEAENKEK